MTDPVKLQFAAPKIEIDKYIYNVISNYGVTYDFDSPVPAAPRVFPVPTRRQHASVRSTSGLRPTDLTDQRTNRQTESVDRRRDSCSSSDEQDERTDTNADAHMSIDPPPSSDRPQSQGNGVPTIEITPEDYYTDDEFSHIFTGWSTQ